MAKLMDNKLEERINLEGYDLNVDIHLYQSNDMPALFLVTDDNEPIKDLTTCHNDEMHIDKCIAIRSDEPENYKLLLEHGWINPRSICSMPQMFIEINFYELTDEAYAKVIEVTKYQEETYLLEGLN